MLSFSEGSCEGNDEDKANSLNIEKKNIELTSG